MSQQLLDPPKKSSFNTESIYSQRQFGRLLKTGKRFRLIDLFAGAGGLTLGFSKQFGHTFQPVWANDFNGYAAQTRWRAFIIGCKFTDPTPFFPPKRTHFNSEIVSRSSLNGDHVANPVPWRTVENVIGDLPSPVGKEIRPMDAPFDLHFGRTPT